MTFLERYKVWHESQRNDIKSFINTKPTFEELPKGLVKIIYPYYKNNVEWRRSIRELSQDESVRTFRREQAEEIFNVIEYVCWLYGQSPPTKENLFGFLLNLENLCDSIARGDFKNLGMSEEASLSVLEDLFASLMRKWTAPVLS